jgi:hypothetical protein
VSNAAKFCAQPGRGAGGADGGSGAEAAGAVIGGADAVSAEATGASGVGCGLQPPMASARAMNAIEEFVVMVMDSFADSVAFGVRNGSPRRPHLKSARPMRQTPNMNSVAMNQATAHRRRPVTIRPIQIAMLVTT